MSKKELIQYVEDHFVVKNELPAFKAGDTITVHYKIKEGEKERIQLFQGVVLQRSGEGVTETFTIRKVSGTIGVERIIPVCSPFIDKIEINKRGAVRRAGLFQRSRSHCAASSSGSGVDCQGVQNNWF